MRHFAMLTLLSCLAVALTAQADENVTQTPGDPPAADTDAAADDIGVGDEPPVSSPPPTTTEKDAEKKAEKRPATTNWNFPLRFSRRPLVMDEYMMRFDVRLVVTGLPTSDTLMAVDLGLAFVPFEHLEIGASNWRTGVVSPLTGRSLLPLVYQPDTDFGDIQTYARYEFVSGKMVRVALDAIFFIPTQTDFAFRGGIPVRIIELFDLFTLDFAVEFQIRTNEPDNLVYDVFLPGSSTINVTDNGFLQLGGGFQIVNINSSTPEDSLVQMFATAAGGYTMDPSDTLLVDFILQAGFVPLTTFKPPPGIDKFNVKDNWQVAFQVNIHTKPLIKKRRRRR